MKLWLRKLPSAFKQEHFSAADVTWMGIAMWCLGRDWNTLAKIIASILGGSVILFVCVLALKLKWEALAEPKAGS